LTIWINPSSTTAKDSFHGTAISLTNHLSEDCCGQEQHLLCESTVALKKNKIGDIPPGFALVPPAGQIRKQPTVPQNDDLVRPATASAEQKWLEDVSELVRKEKLDDEDAITWSAFNAKMQTNVVRPKACIALMLLFHENALSVDTIKHAMLVSKHAIRQVNSFQIPVIVKPLFSIAKQVHWTWPEELGEGKYVVMLGGLHIEMTILKILGTWLDGSGWSTALMNSDITTPGKAESFLSGSQVTRTRYVHQVTAAALHLL
jgi:hypothetical protein